MGIPSYYKKLINVVPGLVSKKHPTVDINWLFMDFNCLIYHCLYRADIPIYPGPEQKDEWEAQFLECIVKYTLKVIKEVNPKQGVFIAIDGVVPMAKCDNRGCGVLNLYGYLKAIQILVLGIETPLHLELYL